MYDTNDICRSCLSAGADLLSMDSMIADSLKIKDCLQVHLSISIAEDDGLPQKICLNCYDSLLEIRKFHLRYLQSEKFLMEQYVQLERQTPDITAVSLKIEPIVTDYEPTQYTYVPLDSESPHEDDMKIEVLATDYEDSSEVGSQSQDDVESTASSEDKAANQAEISRKTGIDYKTSKLFYCLQCNWEFNNRNELRIHFHSVHGEDNAKGFCTQCFTTFPSRGTLMTHLQSHRLAKIIVKCHFCDKTFENRNKLLSHERTHTGEKPYKCNICGRGFSQSSVLGTHMSLHTGKTVECSKCDKKFSRKSFLKVHLRTHDDIRPYACNLCEKKYRMKSHLSSHMLTHSNARNFTCDVCGQSFKEKCVLASHMSIHTRPYKCPKCPLHAAKLYSFRIHLVKMHGITDDPKLFKRSLVKKIDKISNKQMF